MIFCFKDGHEWLKTSTITFLNGNENITETISLEFTNVSMFLCSWFVTDMNVNAAGSKLSWTRLSLSSTYNRGKVLIQNSTVGSIQTGPGFIVTLMNSSINGSERLQGTAIHMINSTFTMVNSAVINNVIGADSGDQAVLRFNSSYTYIENCRFLNNTQTGFIINATNGEVFISRSFFSDNTFNSKIGLFVHGVLRVWNSTLHINTCFFNNNTSEDLGTVLKSFYSNVSVNNSTFKENSAWYGGVYYLVYSSLNSSLCKYMFNTAEDGGDTGRVS